MPIITTPQAGIGITLSYKLSGGSFVPLATLKDDCEFSGYETTVIPIATLATTTLTKVPGRIDNGTFTGSVYLAPGEVTCAELLTLQQARTTVQWQLQLNDGSSSTTGSTYTFNGFVSNVKPGNFTGEDAATQDFEIPISGPVVFAIAT